MKVKQSPLIDTFIDKTKSKYALVNGSARELFEVAPGVFVQRKHLKTRDDFVFGCVADTKEEVYYTRFLAHVEKYGIRRAELSYRQSQNWPKFLARIKIEYPELCI